jgi:hypothetical protein
MTASLIPPWTARTTAEQIRDRGSEMNKKSSKPLVREAVGIFFDSDSLHEAVDELLASGFSLEQIGLLAAESAVGVCLGDYYTQRINESVDADGGPRTAFVAEKSMGDTIHAYFGSLFFVGTTVASGAVVASAAILGGALLAALSGAVALGGIAAAMALILHEGDAEYLEQQVDEGHLLLFVRADDAAHEKKALGILSKHGAFDAKVYAAPAAKRERQRA